jgi:cytochrome o ubiquinol oxidase subunit 1
MYNWLFTMYGGRIRFATPMLWSLGFMTTFITGGLTGVLLAVPPADFLLHNSMFLVAHFHHVIIGGVVFALLAGIEYWWPKAFGYRLHEGWGRASFWFGLTGFYITFMPMYVVGILGMTRRLQHYDIAEWYPWLLVSAAGILILTGGAICQVTQLVVSYLRRQELRDTTGDPWDGRSLEWATASPPPVFNFAVLPRVQGAESYWDVKQRAREAESPATEPQYKPVEMPRNSPTGFVCAFFATIIGFALIWHIWWLMIVGLIGAYVTFVVFAWRDVPEYVISADEVARLDRPNREARQQALSGAAAT